MPGSKDMIFVGFVIVTTIPEAERGGSNAWLAHEEGQKEKPSSYRFKLDTLSIEGNRDNLEINRETAASSPNPQFKRESLMVILSSGGYSTHCQIWCIDLVQTVVHIVTVKPR